MTNINNVSRPPSVAFQNYVDESCGQRIARIGPLKWPGLGIVGVDERQQPADQVTPGFEDPAADDLAGQDAEEDCNLIEPTWAKG